MRYETILARDDGSEVKVVTITNSCPMFGKSWDLFVLKRLQGTPNWTTCSSTPPVGYRDMSREEYETRGRSDMLMAASSSEILKHMKMVHEKEKAREQEH